MGPSDGRRGRPPLRPRVGSVRAAGDGAGYEGQAVPMV